MRKLLTVLIVSLMVLTLFAACAKPAEEAPAAAAAESNTEEMATEEAGDDYMSEKLYVGVAIRSLSNPYQVTIVEGGEMFCAYLDEIGQDYEFQTLVCEGSNDKQVNDIKAFVAKANGNAIIYVDPNEAAIAPAIADVCEESGAYMVTAWNKPEDIGPMDYTKWVSHHSPDNKKSGYDISVAMFESFDTPGVGKILAVQGMLGNTAATDRFIGLERALEEYPDIELLSEQAGDWDTKKALGIVETWLSKYPDVDGIWAANDSMAIGVVQALKAAGLDKTVKVVGVDGIDDAVNFIKSGEMVATVGSNGWLQAGYSLAICYDAWRGVFNVEDLPADKREFNTEGLMITADSVADYEAEFINSKPDYDFSQPWDCIYTAE